MEQEILHRHHHLKVIEVAALALVLVAEAAAVVLEVLGDGLQDLLEEMGERVLQMFMHMSISPVTYAGGGSGGHNGTQTLQELEDQVGAEMVVISPKWTGHSWNPRNRWRRTAVVIIQIIGVAATVVPVS